MTKSLSERIPEHIFSRIHQDIGEASMCWLDADGKPAPPFGFFDATRAGEIAFNLCHFVADEMDKAKNSK